jgi:hypothetical protein
MLPGVTSSWLKVTLDELETKFDLRKWINHYTDEMTKIRIINWPNGFPIRHR